MWLVYSLLAFSLYFLSFTNFSQRTNLLLLFSGMLVIGVGIFGNQLVFVGWKSTGVEPYTLTGEYWQSYLGYLCWLLGLGNIALGFIGAVTEVNKVKGGM